MRPADVLMRDNNNREAKIPMQYRYEYLIPALEGASGGSGSDYKLPIALIPAPALIVDVENRCFHEANAEALAFYGYTHDEFMRLNLGDIYTSDSVGRMQKLLQQHMGITCALGGIWKQKRKDDSEFTASIACNRISYDGRPACLFFPMNIGEFAVPEQNSSNREQAILNALPDLVFETDLEGCIYSFHSGQKENLLLPESEFIGKRLCEIVSDDLSETSLAALAEANEKGHSVGHEYQLILPGRREQSYFEYSIARMETEQGLQTRFIVISRDITARKKAELALQESRDLIKATLDNLPIGIAINSVEPTVNFQYTNEKFFNFYRTTPDALGEPDGFWKSVYEDEEFRQEMKSRVLADIASGDPGKMLWEEVPIVRSGEATRYITARNIPLSHEGIMVSLVWDVSEAKRSRDALEEHVQILEKTMMGTVDVATTISLLRDPYTAGHERRVAAIAEAIAARMQLDAKQIQGIRIGAHLHDVGKVVVPVEILSKPGKLTAAEMQIIRSHAEAGYDVLKGVDFPWPVAEIARSHHERLDGSGYPRGLKGDEIIREARIIAVADVVEAMASHRPYRAGLGIDRALAEIQSGSGLWYDGMVVDACLSLFRECGFTIPEV